MTGFRNNIEKQFEHVAGWIFRHPFIVFAVFFPILGLLFSQLPKITVDTSIEGFLHEKDPSLLAYNDFRDEFGRDEMVLVALKPPNVFDVSFLEKLRIIHADFEANIPYLEEITSMVNARNTRGEKDELIVGDLLETFPKSEAELAALKKRVFDNPLYLNTLISRDGKYTVILIETQSHSGDVGQEDVLEGFDESSEPAPQNTKKRKYLTDEENTEIVRAVSRLVKKYRKQWPEIQFDIAGSPVVTHFLKEEMIKDIRKFMVLAVATIAVFLFFMFRRISGVVFPLVTVVISLLATLSLMAIFQTPIKMPTQILPSFLLAVCVGDSVHILAMFYEHLGKTNDREASIVNALGHSGLAVVLTSLTTAGGLFSFSTAEIAPIGDLGIFAGIGVFIALGFTILFLPALLSVFPVKSREKKVRKKKKFMDRVLTRIENLSTGHPVLILFISLGIVVFSVLGILKVRFSHDPLKWFPKDNSIRIATERVDKELRGSLTLEILLDSGKENGLYNPDIMKRMARTTETMEGLQIGEVFAGKVIALSTILREINRALHENRKEFYTIPETRNLIAQEFLLFENSGSDDLSDFTDSGFRKARMTVKGPFSDAVAYTRLLGTVEERVRKIFPDMKVQLTGMMTLLARTLTSAIHTMAESYVIALVVITLLMIFLIGNIRMGICSMVPNLFPIVLSIGIMGWFSIPMNLFNMLVGSIAIGLAVDDTIHFMHNFRRYYEQSHDAVDAVKKTFDTTGRAMLVTSCVLSAGFFIFMFADMNHLFHFGLLTGVTIITALLADFLITPALMVVVTRRNHVKA